LTSMSAKSWLSRFKTALCSGNAQDIANLFTPAGFWRDYLPFGGSLQTIEGREDIGAFGARTGPAAGLRDVVFEGDEEASEGYCQVVCRGGFGYRRFMNIPNNMPRLKGFRYPREIIAYAVWAYHRLALSTADVEDLLAARGVIVSREAIRLWVNRFGRHFANCIRRDRSRPNDKWHLDEVVITIRGEKHWLWRAIDANGDVLDILVQTRRNAKAAKRFFQRLVAQFGEPRVVITDKLRSYIKPIKALAPDADHRPAGSEVSLRS